MAQLAQTKSKKLPDHDVQYKVLILGESRIGKTSILKRLNNEEFTEQTISTVGIDFINVFYDIESVCVKLQIWDTAGQERFRTITRNYYRNTKGIVLVFDLTDRETYQKLEYWLDSLVELQLDNEIVYLVGNKADLGKEREVSYVEGKRIAERNFVKYFETSAKTGQNLSKIFESLAFDLLDANHMYKMDRYKSKTIGQSFVYNYQMPSTITLPKPTESQAKRRFYYPTWLRKKLKQTKNGKKRQLNADTLPGLSSSKKNQTLFLSTQSVNYTTSTSPNGLPSNTKKGMQKTRSLKSLSEIERSLKPQRIYQFFTFNRNKSVIKIDKNSSEKKKRFDKCCSIS